MNIRKPLALTFALLLSAIAVSAFQSKPADIAGVWSGSFTPDGGGGAREAHMTLKQTGAEVTGTVGPAVDRQVEIRNGKIATAKGVTSVTFEGVQPNGSVMVFDLKLVDGRLKGLASMESNGQKLQAAIDVGRAK